MGRKSIFQASDMEHIVECIDNGMSYKQIADDMGLQYSQIYQWCRNNEAKMNHIRKQWHDEKLMEYIAKGYSIMSRDEIKMALMGGRS